MGKITKKVVDGTVTADKQVHVWDSELRGLCLRVLPSGVRSFVVRYRNEHGRQKWLTIGRVGEITPDQARDEARQLLAAVRRGADPGADRRAKRSGPSVSDLLDRFFAEHVEIHNKGKTQREARRLIKKHVGPALGAIKVAELSLDEVSKFHHGMRKTPRMANHALAVLSKALTFAEEKKLRPVGTNVCKRVKRFAENKRDRVASPEEIVRLRAALDAAEAQGVEYVPALNAIRLLALTGCRLGEILNLRWSDIDFMHGVFRLADSKTGARTHAFGSRVAALLQSLPHVSGSPWIVPAPRDPSRPLRIDVMENLWQRLRKRAGLTDLRLHDLRHTVGTAAGRAGANATTIRDKLGHSTITMAARYTHRDAGALRALSDRIEQQIGADLMGPEWDGQVVPFPSSESDA